MAGFGPGGPMMQGGGIGGRFGRDEQVKGKAVDRKIIKRMVKYALPYWHWFFVSLVMILAVTVGELYRTYLVKQGIDNYLQKGSAGIITAAQAESGIKLTALIFLLLILMEFVFKYVQTYILQRTGKKIILVLRSEIFKKIQNLTISYFDKNAVGRVVTRVTNDTDALNEMYTDVVVGFLQDVFKIVGIVIIMFGLSVRLTLLSFTVIPLMVAVTVFFRKRARIIFGEMRTKLAAINAFISEHISGMRIIQVFNMQQKKYKEFDEINRQYYQANQMQINLFGIFRPFMDVIRSLALALLLWYGGKRIYGGFLQIGTLYLFIDYMNKFFQPIMELTDKFNVMQSSIISAERIFDLLDEEEEPKPSDGGVSLGKARGEIEFRNVWFAYIGENWVLKDVSFKIMAGESIAFVGPTGAGKTSLINLICGFYENQKGEILIDGINIKKIRKNELRTNIGLVLQDVFLFSGDIETNIRLFNKDVSFEKVKEAAEYVKADYFISRLSDGYKHQVCEKGSTLSTGQRQLLSFARALVSDPSILVMDEATSNIDTETESLIQEALGKIMKGRTTIAIAHRLSTIQKADKIIVVHKGAIKEMGTHQELLEQEGLYYHLYQLQYQGEEKDLI